MNRPSNTILSKTPTSFIYTIMNTLQPSWRVMAAIACLTAEGDMLRLPTAIADGLDHGLTIAEIKEALSQLYAYVGFPRSLNALAALQKVVEERKAQGIADAEGIDAGPMPRDFDALQEGTRVQTRLNGGQPFDYHFAPATDHYLKAHLFGDIFARNNLTFAQREWITLGALCGLSGVENQRKAHIAGARNMGVADEVILALPGVLQQLVGEQEAYRAGKSVAEFFGLPFNSPRPVRPLAFPVGEPNTAFARYFTGNSHLASLLDNGRLTIHNVTFEPGCRNNWHIHHHTGQILICVAGKGWYQEWQKPPRALREGDVVNIPPEVKHWHGATRNSLFQHLAIALTDEQASNEWLEAVTDAEYDLAEQLFRAYEHR